MTRRCEQATLAFIFAGVLAMLACALYARFTQPSIVKRAPAEAQQAQAGTSPAQNRISALMAEVAQNPGNADALLELAQEFMSQGQPDAAAGFLDRAMLADAANPMPPYLLGYVRHQQGREQEACELMERSLSIRDQAAVRASLGVVYRYYAKDKDKAKAHWQRALELPDLDAEQRKTVEAELAKLAQEQDATP
jgi:tetratricopeptide (TPR) repeat protein